MILLLIIPTISAISVIDEAGTKGCVYSPKYNGTLNVTRDGFPCQRWDSQSPHEHNRNKDDNFPNDGSVSDANNYCRDADGTYELWCYTTNPEVRFQKCDVNVCQPPRVRQSDCGDRLPSNKTSRHCPIDTVYYMCFLGPMSFPRSIEYHVDCDLYYCCNPNMNDTTSKDPLVTSKVDYIDSNKSESSPRIYHITTELSSTSEVITYTTTMSRSSKTFVSTSDTVNGSDTNYFKFKLNDLVFCLFIFVYKRML
ncbi:plasminogen-like [Ruditapes philippinarum]|uniref:plasminogen-like n=1 Tax=Ruditapes philippinarum TaxID=129788 RepID=UPI00295B1FF2|nr:plasminogen-like [Ruditapes philippinarum]